MATKVVYHHRSLHPGSSRREQGGKTMKSSMKDELQGKWHKFKGKIEDFAGKL
jgi:hypothetical protein